MSMPLSEVVADDLADDLLLLGHVVDRHASSCRRALRVALQWMSQPEKHIG
jgi:hypothetical protein